MSTARTDFQPAPFQGAQAPAWDVLANGVRLIALRALGDPAQAADVAQETIARALAILADRRGEGVGDLGAYIHGIARHVIADHQRRQQRFVGLDAIPEPAAPQQDPLAAAVAEDERSRLHAALAALAPRDLAVVRLFFFDLLDDRTIAARVGDSAVNVRKRRSRAIGRLRAAMLGHKAPPDATDST